MIKVEETHNFKKQATTHDYLTSGVDTTLAVKSLVEMAKKDFKKAVKKLGLV